MPDFSSFPRALAERTKIARFGEVPVLMCHPDWRSTCPWVLWLHGRTVSKEIDSGRYLRLIRAGIAVCAMDLPGHGDRFNIDLQHPRRTLDLLALTTRDIDVVTRALGGAEYNSLFDADRGAIGGMSAGGMATLRRLCEPHEFLSCVIESSTGWLEGLYVPGDDAAALTKAPWAVSQDLTRVRELDPMGHLAAFKPVPMLVLHSEADAIVPWAGMRRFTEALREHYRHSGADASLVERVTWPSTGAPQEHAGFGRAANDAKNALVAFYTKTLNAQPLPEAF
ncbi:MAG: alpha/beta hydrolase family protein [Phycisphaerales bacterium]|jgi:alpha-beta hydrolase superfamily lysophospholipase